MKLYSSNNSKFLMLSTSGNRPSIISLDLTALISHLNGTMQYFFFLQHPQDSSMLSRCASSPLRLNSVLISSHLSTDAPLRGFHSLAIAKTLLLREGAGNTAVWVSPQDPAFSCTVFVLESEMYRPNGHFLLHFFSWQGHVYCVPQQLCHFTQPPTVCRVFHSPCILSHTWFLFDFLLTAAVVLDVMWDLLRGFDLHLPID